MKYTSKHLIIEYFCIYPSIRDRVHRNENFVEIITVFSTFFNFFKKKPLEKPFLDFKKWVKSIQTASYNGARMVYAKIFNY